MKLLQSSEPVSVVVEVTRGSEVLRYEFPHAVDARLDLEHLVRNPTDYELAEQGWPAMVRPVREGVRFALELTAREHNAGVTKLQPAAYIVLRPAFDLPDGFMPRGLDGVWFDQRQLEHGPPLTHMQVGAATAHATQRYEVREDGARAQVFEVRRG